MDRLSGALPVLCRETSSCASKSPVTTNEHRAIKTLAQTDAGELPKASPHAPWRACSRKSSLADGILLVDTFVVSALRHASITPVCLILVTPSVDA